MIVNGDMSQIDLPRRVKSGLVDAMEKLKGIKAIDLFTSLLAMSYVTQL